jgi:TonB family protein
MKPIFKILAGYALALALAQFCLAQDSPPTPPSAPGNPPTKCCAHALKIVVAPRPVSVVRPAYPKGARKKKIEGSVLLRATVALDGSLRDITVVSGDPILADAALEAVRQWRYQPSKVNGEPIEAQHEITVTFKRDESTAQIGPDDLSPDVPLEPPEDIEKRMVAGEFFSSSSREVRYPRAVYSPAPEYSEPARKAKYQGTCILGLIVGADGTPLSVWITRPLGLGLDEKAIEAVQKWRFDPATKDGEPMAVLLNVEVSFRLY